MYRKTDDKHELIDQREMLKVKVKSLAEEARIIRKEERKTFGRLRNLLQKHRRGTVRQEARSSFVAYGLVKGLEYRRIENKTKTEPDWKVVERMYMRYGPRGANGLPSHLMKGSKMEGSRMDG